MENQKHQFPLETLSKVFQEIILSLNSSFSYPIPYSAIALIAAVATAMGTTLKLRFKQGFEVFGNIYCYFISDPGTAKSHPISWMFSPILKRHQMALKQHRADYDSFLIENAGKKGKERLKEPVFKGLIIKDFTPESLIKELCNNPNGLAAIIDELMAMFKNANRYNGASLSEQLNEIFSNIPIYKTRVSSEPLYCPTPCLTIIGTTQPAMLTEMYSKDKAKNGGTARFLPAFPKDLPIPLWTNIEHDSEMKQQYEQMINQLLDTNLELDEDGNPISHIIEFTNEAKSAVIAWQSEFAKKIEREDRGQSYQDSMTKLPIYLLKFSLLNQAMRFIAGEADLDAVDLISVNNSIAQIEYFETQILLVHDFVYGKNLILKMTEQQRAVFATLPSSFCISDVYDLVMDKASFSKDQLKKFVRIKEYFIRTSKGNYTKRFEEIND